MEYPCRPTVVVAEPPRLRKNRAMNNEINQLKNMEFAGMSSGALVTGLGLLLWSPIVGGFNIIGFLLTIFGLVALGGFAKNKWY